MGILSFFTFLRSPVYIVSIFIVGSFFFFHVSSSSSSHIHRLSVFFLFLFIEFCGGAIGSIVGENQHRMLTWTLPHFRKRLMIWSIIVGLFSVVAWTIILTYASLNASWLTILFLNMCLYCLGFTLFGGWSIDTNRPGLIYKCRVPLTLLVLASAYLWQEILAFGEQQKLGLALIAFAIAIGTHYFAFNQTTFRRKPFSFLVGSIHSGSDPQTREIWKQNAMMMRKTSTGVWHLDHIGTGIFNWLRAGQYENYGQGILGWPLSAFSAVLVMVFFFLGMRTHLFGLWDQSPYDFETLSKMIYHMMFYFDQLDSKVVGGIFSAVFFGIVMYLFMPPISLKRGYVYPLSRSQQMWIQYCGYSCKIFLFS